MGCTKRRTVAPDVKAHRCTCRVQTIEVKHSMLGVLKPLESPGVQELNGTSWSGWPEEHDETGRSDAATLADQGQAGTTTRHTRHTMEAGNGGKRSSTRGKVTDATVRVGRQKQLS
jgi:hypothetical protein